MVELICLKCGRSFQRTVKEHNRNRKLGRRPFCSLSCSASYLNSAKELNPNGNPENLRKGSESDEFSPFRWYLKVSRQRKRHENNLTLEYLKEIWEKQNGVCPYTGVKLKLPATTKNRSEGLDFASLDRIDSSKGYIRGNIEFVSLFINYAKNKFSREQVEDFLKKIRPS